MSSYKFSIGDRITARYTHERTVEGKITELVAGWSTPAYKIRPDGHPLSQLFWEHELTKVSQPEESPYTTAIAAVDAQIEKHEREQREARRKISSLVALRTSLTDLKRTEDAKR